MDWISSELEAWEKAQLTRHRLLRENPPGPFVRIEGRELVNFGSNDYLGLAGDVRLAEAIAAAAQEGCGAGASPLITGYGPQPASLEEELARFEATEGALLFSSGFAANVGTIPALVGEGDCIYSDALNHAGIIDGSRLSAAEVRVYPHADAARLEDMLREGKKYRRRLIVTDGLFSMDGDLAPLAELADLAERFECMLMVDEAHATGIFGQNGRGAAEHCGAEEKVAVRMGTLSKALGCSGGFIAGEKRLCDWLVHRARSYVFSTGVASPVCAAARAALKIVVNEPQRRRNLLASAERLRGALREQGWNVGQSQSQIIPLIVGEAGRTLALAGRLRERGYYVPAIRPPSVPSASSRLRISLGSLHTPEMLDGLISTLRSLSEPAA